MSTQDVASVELLSAVRSALEDERYDWRTVSGLSRQLKLTDSDILNLLQKIEDVVRSSDETGRSLFTTRSHYEKTHGLGDKLLSALADKVVA